jgi:hypothetical protein
LFGRGLLIEIVIPIRITIHFLKRIDCIFHKKKKKKKKKKNKNILINLIFFFEKRRRKKPKSPFTVRVVGQPHMEPGVVRPPPEHLGVAQATQESPCRIPIAPRSAKD